MTSSILTTDGVKQRLLRNAKDSSTKPLNVFKRKVAERKLTKFNSVAVTMGDTTVVSPVLNSSGASKIINTMSTAVGVALLATLESILDKSNSSKGFQYPQYEAVRFLTEVLYFEDNYYSKIEHNATLLAATAIAGTIRATGSSRSVCYIKIGRAVYTEACYFKYSPRDKEAALTAAGADGIASANAMNTLAGSNKVVDTYPPTTELFIKIGCLFVDILLQSGLIEFDVDRDNTQHLRLTKQIEEFIADVSIQDALRKPVKTPMLTPPVDWSSLLRGGFDRPELRKIYPLLKRNVGRSGASNGVYGQYEGLEETPDFIKAVNVLQRTAFRINETVLETAKLLWQSGKELGSLSRSKPLDTSLTPEMYELYNTKYKKFIKDMYGTATLRKQSTVNAFGNPWPKKPSARYMFDAFLSHLYNTGEATLEQCDTYRKLFANRIENIFENSRGSTYTHFLGCYMLLAIADELKGKDFYYVWTLDSRGRVYAESTDINPQGTDLHKAMHLFGEAKPLTARGLYHLKLQATATMDTYDGVDLTKLPLVERIKWADDHFDILHEIGTNPADNLHHLEAAGEPWMFLATCVELAKCCNYDGSIKKGAMTSLPVAKDGSCNALQYCAALSADSELAVEVNLIDSYKPGDIYTRVAKGMLSILDKAEQGVPEYAALFKVREKDKERASSPTKLMKELRPFINRKLAKHPTMTLFYGATSYGMRNMCEKVIMDKLGKSGIAALGNQFVLDLCTVAGNVVRKSISEQIKGADILMNISKHIAKFLSSESLPIVWSTIDGFTVVQDYVKSERDDVARLRTINGDCRVVKVRHQSKSSDTPDVMRSVNGISPNLVHSYDGTLVRMVALRMNQHHNINSFMMIHDSFACNAEDCDVLDKVTRNQFVKLVTERPYEVWMMEVLGLLNDELYAKFLEQTRKAVEAGELGGLEVREDGGLRLNKGTLDVKSEVPNSRFFFA